MMAPLAGFSAWRERAAKLDTSGLAREWRDRFELPEAAGYFLGNSLGPLTRAGRTATQRVLDEWSRLGIEGWTGAAVPWFTAVEALTPAMAAIVGAKPAEVTLANSLTVNLHQVLHTLLAGRTRPRLVTDALSFPSDAVALESFVRERGGELVRIPSRDGWTLAEADILAALETPGDLLWLPSVVYTSGQLLDLPRLTAAAQARDYRVGWDLAHSAGVVDHELHASGADAAVWCTYKYLCGGPGAIGAVFLHERHRSQPAGLAGWFGAAPSDRFGPAASARREGDAGRLQIGTPSILSLAALQGSLPLFERIGLRSIRQASLRLTGFFRELVEAELAPRGFTVVTPRDDAARGGHLALAHADAHALSRHLRTRGWVLDFRRPGLLRVALHPLFNTATEAVGLGAEIASWSEGSASSEPPVGPELVP